MAIDFSSYASNDMVYALLQFKGPVKQGWKDAAKGYGIDLIQPESGFSYIAHGQKSAFESFAKEPFVRWYGPYQPYYKLRNGADYSLDIKENTWRKFTVWVFDQERANLNSIKSKINATGASIYWQYQFNHWPFEIEFMGSWDMLPSIAKMDGVYFIEPRPEYFIFNDKASWVLQTNVASSRTIFDHGITGAGVILAVADTGVATNHANFQGPGKIVRYWACADGTDGHGHGSHVSGTVLGDGGTQGSYDTSTYDGMSFGGKLSMQDIAVGGSIQCATPSQNGAEAVKDGAVVEQNSWGGGTDGSYGSSAEDADQFMWTNSISAEPTFLFSFSNGNSGPSKSSCASPANSKSGMAVGATQPGQTKDMASFSSRGPTNDGRFSPTIIAPGVDTMSVNYQGGYTAMSGTSMSGPAAAGMTGLVAQYFNEGWYPGGSKGSGAGFKPSGTLLKAMLINSAADQVGGSGVNGNFPNDDQGWGKILLEDALYFDKDARKLWVEDGYTNGKPGLTTGESREFPLTVKAGQPLKITIAWTDFAGNGLKNDLNLKVTAPGGTEYLGNAFSNGESQAGGTADNKNTNEQVLLKSAPAGDYLISVSAVSIGGGTDQKFALVATGDVEGGSGMMVASPKGGMYKGGAKLTIDYKSFGTVQDGSVKIEYTLDGSTYTQIASGQPKSGTYP
jgi:subtilisin family serine protease